MREIKFRAWDNLNKIMLSWDRFKNIKFDIGDGYEVGIPLDILDEKYQKQHRLKPLQFTGLKDKNGKDIYEGDIVKSDVGLCEVEWIGSGLSLHTLPRESSRSIFSVNYHECEVIGNIFENKDLLTK